jgi:hypothetical protein
MLHSRTLFPLVGLALLLAGSARAADTVHLTIDASSPELVGTGLTAEPDHSFLVQAQGALRLQAGLPVTDGWFGAGGLGRLTRASQIFADAPYGLLLGTFGAVINTASPLGALATFDSPSNQYGTELKLGLNLSAQDQADLEGALHVQVTRFTAAEITQTTVVLDASASQPVATGLIADAVGQRFLVVGQGAARRSVLASRPVTAGWFGAGGLGRYASATQPLADAPYGQLLGMMFGQSSNDLFSVGEFAAWSVSSFDLGRELLLGLNLSEESLADLEGQILAHVLRIDDVVVSAAPGTEVPDRDAILAVSNYPNPFNPTTTVRFALASEQQVRVAVLDVAGALVRILAEGAHGPGQHELTWDGRDRAGRPLASGTYLLRLQTPGASESRKLTLVR